MDIVLEKFQSIVAQQIMQELRSQNAVQGISPQPEFSQQACHVKQSSFNAHENELMIPIGVSNRHIHLCQSDMEALFGSGAKLTRFKALKQPGQFAAKETVTIRGPKKEIKNVRILGPLRSETQIEISIADSFILGLSAPVKISGDLENTPGIEIIGPRGSVIKDFGVIVAWRHIHMHAEFAKRLNLKDWQEVSIAIDGTRGGVMHHVLVRTAQEAVTEMHVDMDEANAFGLANDQLVKIIPA